MEEIVRDICRQEGLPCQSIQAVAGGQINAVFRVDGSYIVRVGTREDARERLEHETGLLRSLTGRVPVAEVLGFGQAQGWWYQVQRYVPGQKLYETWTSLDAGAQDAVAAQVAEAMQTLHSATLSGFGEARRADRRYATWMEYLSQSFTETVAEIRERNIRMVPGFLETAEQYFEAHRHVLQGGTPTLVHSDLNLGNILAQSGQVTALLDFEFALQAPADYELQAIEAFCLYPNDWAEEGSEVYCTADFASLIPLIRRHYPALFAVPNLRKRLDVYHVYAALRSYLEWRKANLATIPPEVMAAKHFYMGRFWNIVYDAGARMFHQ